MHWCVNFSMNDISYGHQESEGLNNIQLVKDATIKNKDFCSTSGSPSKGHQEPLLISHFYSTELGIKLNTIYIDECINTAKILTPDISNNFGGIYQTYYSG